MNLAQIIEKVNKYKPSALDEEEIAAFVNELESDIVLSLYEIPAAEYVAVTPEDVGRELSAPLQYEKIYAEYVFAQIDLVNSQTEAYMLSHDQFNNTYTELGAYITRSDLKYKDPNKLNRFNSYF